MWKTWLRILPRLWRNGLVVIDAPPVPVGRVWLAEKRMPKPDLVFYLEAPADVICMGSRARVVDVQRPVLEIVNHLREQVFDHLARREQRHASLLAEDPAFSVRM